MVSSLSLPGVLVRPMISVVAIAWCLVQFAPAIRGPYEYEMIFLASHVCAAVAIGILMTSANGARRADGEALPLVDIVLLVFTGAAFVYLAMQGGRVAERIAGVDSVALGDKIFGVLLIVALLEACRRTAGLILTLVAIVFMAYLFAGPFLPGAFAHRGISFARFIDLQVISFSGIFGTPISASAYMVFYFVLVGSFLERSGAGQLFVNLAHALTARARGGAGKAAVVSSGLFGMISGSAVANVLLSGLMTIPLMKRAGFSPRFAASVEATASTGGQLAPPIMGAAAFIVADIVGVGYDQVVFAAIVPAILYYLSLFLVVHFHSLKMGMQPTPDANLREPVQGLIKRWHLLVPLAAMLVMLIQRYSLMTVGIYVTLLIIVVAALRADTRMGLRQIHEALISGIRSAADVAIPSAVAGIIVGALIHTGMALNLQRFIIAYADGSSIIALVGAAFLTLILGMGMPTAAAYMVSAILVAPALQSLGFPALASHMFILYFGILSMVTPPVALSAYAAAGISGSRLWSTGVQAFMLALPGFLIPFAFVLNDALILQGPVDEFLRTAASCLAGICLIAASLAGYMFATMGPLMRLALFATAPLLIMPSWKTDTIGIAVALTLVVAHWYFGRRSARTQPVAKQAKGEEV